MNKATACFVLTSIVAGVIMGDHFLSAPWKFAVWGLGLSLPWVIMARFVSLRSE